jgi:signal transduction histidine kinase
MDEVEQLRQRIQELEAELAKVHEGNKAGVIELRRLLVPMKGFVRTLLDDEKEEWYTREDRREFYQIIEENVDRLKSLLKDVENGSFTPTSDSAGLEMHWQDVDVRQVIESVVEIQRQRTDKHQLVIDFEPEQIVVESDPEKLTNILHNLINNAIKYSPIESEVRIIARLEPTDEVYPSGALLMAVQDQGIGLSQEKLQTVLRWNCRPVPGCGGIGLMLVRCLTEAHHGTVWAESAGEGKGSTFSIRIPMKQPKGETFVK